MAVSHQDKLEQIIDQKLTDNQIKYIKQGRKLQDDLAYKLQTKCQVPIRLEGNNLEDLKIFENHLEITCF